jgi:tetratricopeptide (TPR) repeat protein
VVEKTPRNTFERAISLLKNGDHDEAETLCRSWLSENARDVNFLSLLGSILLRKNDFEGAEQLLRTVAEIAPGYPNVHEDLGTVLLNLGRPEDALIPLQKAIEQNPKSASGFSKLGGALKSLGRDEAGDAALKYAADLSPAQADLEKATMLFAEGKFREAEVIAKKLIDINPRDVNAGLLLGRIAIDARAYDDAETLLRKVVEMAPRFVAAWHDLAAVLKEQGKEEEAIKALEKVIKMEPTNAGSHYYYAGLLAMVGRTEESAESYKNSVEIDPNLVGAYLGLGHVLKTLGDQDGGIKAYRAGIALRPNLGEIYFSLSNLKTFRFSDDEIEDMVKRINQESLSPESVVHFAFSLGKAFEDNKDYDRAFQYYSQGNQEHRNSIAYDPVRTEVAHSKMKEVFSEEFFNRIKKTQAGVQDPDPIFIVGLPRSGSTLLEQILASHSLVDGTSELADLGIVSQMISDKDKGRAFPSGILQMSDEEITYLGQQYLDRTQQQRRGAPFFTDKMPNNFAHVGLIQAILPNAKIIDARRHPLDSCVGSFKQHFAKGQTFTYDMFELGEFYLQYDQLMTHWNQVLPGKVLRVQYEDVVQDLETQVRRILDYCELPFEEACVNFHETERAVRTASSEQVRQPIYNKSINTWKRFEAHIGPLIEILEPLLDKSDPTIIVR